jgi:predicted transcriptional regulator of viral defense system
MAKKMNWIRVERTIRRNDLRVFTPQDLRHLLRASETSVRFLLTRALKRGDVIKLRRGLYALSDHLPNELELGNALIKPSYISFLYALSYYHLISEAVFEITSATTRTTRRFEALGKVFTYHHIKSAAFTGYLSENINGRTILIAEPEKALVDCLYFASLGQLSLPDRLDLSTVNSKRIMALAQLYRRPTLVEKVEELL